MSWQKYRKPKETEIQIKPYATWPKVVPDKYPAAIVKNRKAAEQKIQQLRNYDPLEKHVARRAAAAAMTVPQLLLSGQGKEEVARRKKIHSSVSLPKFTAARLRYGAQLHRKTFHCHWLHKYRRPASESEILLACLVLLLGKLKRREGQLRAVVGPRLRMYNEDVYSYETVTVYAERSLWLALQARALELEVSLSFLADLAVRLYLNFVLEKLIERRVDLRQVLRRQPHVPQGAGWAKTLEMVGVDYLRNLLHVVSYQKKPLLTRYSHPPWARPGVFSLQIDYCFGQKTPAAA